METTGYQKTNSLQVLIKPVFFIAALFIATYVVLKVEKLKPSDMGSYQSIFQKEMIIERSSYYPLRRSTGMLAAEERSYAEIAWKYFVNNCDEKTGLVKGTEERDAASLNDISSYMMGMISAYEIGIIEKKELDKRMSKLLASLQKLPLYDKKLPNKWYSVSTLEMLDHGYKLSAKGAGWSGLEVGRFFTVVQKIKHDYPQYSEQLKKITSRWDMSEIISEGYIYGTVRTSDNVIHKVQQGTLGYEEYCAKGLMMSGYDVSEAMLYTDFLKYEQINDKDIPVDTRAADYSSIPNYLTSDPYVYDGLEYGWDVTSKEIAYRIYKVQEQRFNETGVPTAVAEEPVDTVPGYAYNCVYAAGEEWNCIDEQGNVKEDLRNISTKTAFAWYALYNDDYSDRLYYEVKSLNDPDKGWYAGKYEKNGRVNKVLSAATNGTVLEALNYRMNGKIMRF